MEQTGNEKHTNGRWGKKSIAEKRVGWIMQPDLIWKKVAGDDLLFHLFLRINYAKMLIMDIMNFSICYE